MLPDRGIDDGVSDGRWANEEIADGAPVGVGLFIDRDMALTGITGITAATVHPIMTFAVPAAVDVAVVIANGQRAPEPHALANEPSLSALAPPPAAYSLWTAAKTNQVHPSSSSLAP